MKLAIEELSTSAELGSGSCDCSKSAGNKVHGGGGLGKTWSLISSSLW